MIVRFQSHSFLNYKFQHLGGYNLLRDAIHEALIKKVGILRVYYKEEPKTETEATAETEAPADTTETDK